jgi:hypothetical protein
VLLTSFATRKGASGIHKHVEAELRSRGDTLLDSEIIEVNAKHKVTHHDPRRVWMSTLVAALTWGIFGLLAGSSHLISGIIWAVIGALCGALFSFYSMSHFVKSEWTPIGKHLRANTSVLATYAEVDDVPSLLASTAKLNPKPISASMAVIGDDLTTHLYAGNGTTHDLASSASDQRSQSDRVPVLSMVMLRFPGTTAGINAAHKMTPKKKSKTPPPFSVELVIETYPDGHRKVIDPKYGIWAWAKGDVWGWGILGVVVGLIAGLVSGGLFGAVKGGIVTGLIWAAFGLVAGALWGLWAGRSVSARRLKSVGPLLGPNTSMIVAWSEVPSPESALQPFLAPDAQHLVLNFNAVEGGASLEAASA